MPLPQHFPRTRLFGRRSLAGEELPLAQHAGAGRTGKIGIQRRFLQRLQYPESVELWSGIGADGHSEYRSVRQGSNGL